MTCTTLTFTLAQQIPQNTWEKKMLGYKLVITFFFSNHSICCKPLSRVNVSLVCLCFGTLNTFTALTKSKLWQFVLFILSLSQKINSEIPPWLQGHVARCCSAQSHTHIHVSKESAVLLYVWILQKEQVDPDRFRSGSHNHRCVFVTEELCATRAVFNIQQRWYHLDKVV